MASSSATPGAATAAGPAALAADNPIVDPDLENDAVSWPKDRLARN
jgi:hypothetical protein